MACVTFDSIKNKETAVCVVGLGYVGLPLAVLLSKHVKVIGFDVNKTRIDELSNGHDRTEEVSAVDLKASDITYTADATKLAEAKFIIVAVPTPVDKNNIPDMGIVRAATKTVAEHVTDGTIIVYESTVYPGATEEECVPILESVSGKTVGKEIKIGYSPERVNPGDKQHTIDKVVKVVSGMDAESLEVIAQLYGLLTTVHKAPSIRVAEAAKVIENAQRDINIAFVNELAILFHKMGISVYDVLEAAGTKWNFLPFKPGFVGGHCIGVDPYYLTYKAQEVGHTPEVILAGRGINDSMHKFVAHRIIKKLVQMGKDVSKAEFVILGITFKENVPDVRNSKVAALHDELKDFGVNLSVYDPLADAEEVQHEYGITLAAKEDLPKADVLITAVAHDEFAQMSADDVRALMKDQSLFVDIKRLFDAKDFEGNGHAYWTL